MWLTYKHVSKQADSLISLNEHRDLNTWDTTHNDGNNRWIVFEYEWVILSRTPDVTIQ